MSSEAGGVVTGEKAQGRGLVPKLRFPEFREAGVWPTKPLSALASRTTRRNTDQQITRVLTNSAEYGVVDQRDYFEKEIATQGNLDAYFIVEHGDYVYNPRVSNAAPVGPIGKNKIGTGVMSPLYTVFRFFDNNDGFYEQYFRSTHWHSYLRHASNSGARHDRMAITNDDLMRMPLPAPSEAEQHKIDDCLSSLDALIAAEGERLAALKAHKKALTQALFPTFGQNTPRIRFPEFEGEGEWEEKALGPRTVKVGSGITPRGGQAAYKKTGRPFMRSQNVGWGELLLDDVAFIDERTHAEFPSTEIKVKDVLLNITGASIGRSALADDRIAGGNVSQHVCILRVNEDEITPAYLNQFLLSQQGQAQIANFQAGGNRQGLNFDQIRSLQVPLPPSASEQQRVAELLSSNDALIAETASAVRLLKRHKSGLMQQLFPSAAEANG